MAWFDIFILKGCVYSMDFILLIVLFIWFSLILPGVKVGRFVLCGSAIKGRSKLEIIMWLVFLLLLPIYVLLPFVGSIAMLVFLLLWLVAQWFFTIQYIFFPNEHRIKAYNQHFKHSHHIIKPSDKRLVPDTYHIVLFVLLAICLATTIFNLIYS